MKRTVIALVMAVLPLWGMSQSVIEKSYDSNYFSEGEAAYDRKAYTAAIENFEKYLHSETDVNSEKYRMAKYYISQSQFRLRSKDAYEELEEYIESYPYSPNKDQSLFSLGTINFEDQNFQKAINWFEQIDEKNLQSYDKTDYLFRKGYSYIKLKKYSKARPSFNELVGKETRYEKSATYYLGYCDYMLKNYPSALNKFRAIESDPEYHNIVPYYIVQIYYAMGNYDELIPYAENVLAKNPKADNNSEIHRILGECYYRQKQYAQAVANLNNYKNKEKQLVRNDLYMLGVANYEIGDYNKAIENLSKVITQKDALTQNAYYYLANCYFKLGDKSNARLSFESAAKYSYDKKMQEESQFNYAVLTYDLSFSPFSESIVAFEQFLDKFPNSQYRPEVYNYLTNVYLTTKNYEQAYKSIQKAPKNDPKIQEALQRVLYYMGMQSFINEDYNDAIDKLTQSIGVPSINKILALSYYWRGEAYFRQQKYLFAAQDYEKVLVTPGIRLQEEYALAHYSLGYVYFNQKEYIRALNWFRMYVDIKDHTNTELFIDAYNRIGDCFFNQRNFKESEKAYSNAINMGNTEKETLYSMYQKGVVLGLQRKYNEKIKVLESLVSMYPRSEYSDKALFEIAQAYVALKDSRRAIDSYTRIEKLYSKGKMAKRASLEKGLLYYNMNENENALNAFQQVVTNFPESEEAKTALESIEVIYTENNKVDAYSSFLKSVGKEGYLEPAKEDSLTFVAAERSFMNDGCKASENFENYLNKYPEGRNKISAHNYLASCYYENKDYDKSLEHYELLASYKGFSNEEEVVARCAEMLYDKKEFTKAYDYFRRLLQITSDENTKNIGATGMLRCAYNDNNYEKTIEIADIILGKGVKDNNLEREAHYKRMKSFLALNKNANAVKDMEFLKEDTRLENGSEAQYLLSEYYYQNGELDNAEKQIFEFIDKGSVHQYWLAKSFILLSDVYKDKNDMFQAKQYLLSLKNNYKGDSEILEEAQKRLDAIEKIETETVYEINDEVE